MSKHVTQVRGSACTYWLHHKNSLLSRSLSTFIHRLSVCHIQGTVPGPVNLSLTVRWNQYYQTTTDNAAPRHDVTAVQQPQSGLVWIHSELASSSDLGPDCQICIQNLHPYLDGVKSVERVESHSIIVIKTTCQLDQTDLCAIMDTVIRRPAGIPTVKIACKVNCQVILHQLTIDSLVTSHQQDMPLTQLQQLLVHTAAQQQATLQPQSLQQEASMHPHAQAGLLQTSHYQPHVLPSRVLHRSSHQSGGQHANDAAASSTSHVSMKLVSVCIAILCSPLLCTDVVTADSQSTVGAYTVAGQLM